MKKIPLPISAEVREAIQRLGISDEEQRGAFYTKREVASFMLDLAGYTANKDLHTVSLLDPCFGEGAFLFEAVKRLITSARKRNIPFVSLKNNIRGVEISKDSFAYTKSHLRHLLKKEGLSTKEISFLIKSWLIEYDFLLTEFDSTFDHVVGNPPYVRLEKIEKPLLKEYRSRFSTMGERSDLYIAFLERSLDLVNKNGLVTFICSDRWVRNRYGTAIRKKIEKDFSLEYSLSLHNANPFESNVAAYSGIFLIRKGLKRETIFREMSEISESSLSDETRIFKSRIDKKDNKFVPSIFNWHGNQSEVTTILEKLSADMPTLKESGVHVGIGVATGCDDFFILDEGNRWRVEEDRLVKLALRGDVQEEGVAWSGKYFINTFDNAGKLIDLSAYPKTAAYFEEWKDTLKKRHVAQKRPHHWFRTIDKPNLSLLSQPRIYIPDIMYSPQIAYTTGGQYPHHNLYWMTSEVWDIRAVKTILKSTIGFLFVDTFSTKMRGGYYRYQAQTLRKIRVPFWQNIDPAIQKKLIQLHTSNDFAAIDEAVANAYSLPIPHRRSLSVGDTTYGFKLSKVRHTHT